MKAFLLIPLTLVFLFYYNPAVKSQKFNDFIQNELTEIENILNPSKESENENQSENLSENQNDNQVNQEAEAGQNQINQKEEKSQTQTDSSQIIFEYSENNPLYFGNPSNAKADTTSPENYLMEKKQYTLSYNNQNLGPNWAAWHLSSSDLGSADRSDKFIPDPELPDEWYAVKKADYQYTAYGFDRGHVCPSADRTLTKEDNEQTFLMTNMLPQAPDCNRNVWKNLEEYERNLASEGNELYIFAGGYGRGGTGQTGYFEEIKLNNGAIAVPQYCWKIILILPEGTDDFSRVDENTSVIAVSIPNKQGCHNEGGWEHYKCSIDYIEKMTGYDFFYLLPDSIENALED